MAKTKVWSAMRATNRSIKNAPRVNWEIPKTLSTQWGEKLTVEKINALLNKAPLTIDAAWLDPRISTIRTDTAILAASKLPNIDEKKLLIMEFLHLNGIPEDEYERQIEKLMDIMDIDDLRRKVEFLRTELSRVEWEIQQVDPFGVL